MYTQANPYHLFLPHLRNIYIANTDVYICTGIVLCVTVEFYLYVAITLTLLFPPFSSSSRSSLTLLEGWACQVGFKDAVLHHLAKLSSLLDILATPPHQLVQVRPHPSLSCMNTHPNATHTVTLPLLL